MVLVHIHGTGQFKGVKQVGHLFQSKWCQRGSNPVSVLRVRWVETGMENSTEGMMGQLIPASEIMQLNAFAMKAQVIILLR